MNMTTDDDVLLDDDARERALREAARESDAEYDELAHQLESDYRTRVVHDLVALLHKGRLHLYNDELLYVQRVSRLSEQLAGPVLQDLCYGERRYKTAVCRLAGLLCLSMPRSGLLREQL